jgi:hypothetical protein
MIWTETDAAKKKSAVSSMQEFAVYCRISTASFIQAFRLRPGGFFI